MSIDDISRLLELVSHLAEERRCAPSEVIENIAQLFLGEEGGQLRSRSALAEFVARLRRLRMRRNELIGAPLFRDPAWDMLLELFATHERGHKVSVGSLCYASGVPATTALRQLTLLQDHGLIVRQGCPKDNRRFFVQPTPKAVKGVAVAATIMVRESEALCTVERDDSRRCA